MSRCCNVRLIGCCVTTVRARKLWCLNGRWRAQLPSFSTPGNGERIMTAVRRSGWFSRGARQRLGRPGSWVASALSVPLLLSALVIAPVSPQAGAGGDSGDLRDVHRGERRNTVFVGRAGCAEGLYQRRLSHRRHRRGQSTAADPRLCKPRCGLSGRRHLPSDPNPRQPSGRGRGEVETSRPRAASTPPSRVINEAATTGTGSVSSWPPRIPQSGGANGHRTAGRRPRLRLGACRRHPGLAYGYLGVGLDGYGNVSNPVVDGSGVPIPHGTRGRTPVRSWCGARATGASATAP